MERISFLLSEERIDRYTEAGKIYQNGIDLSTAEKADIADDLVKDLDDFYLILSLGKILHHAIQALTHYSIVTPTPVKKRTAGKAYASSPLLCICVYFCCHPHAELEAFDVGVALR